MPARHAPSLVQFALSSERQARNDQLAHAVGRAFSDGDAVGDSLRRIVEDGLWLELQVEVAAAAIFVPDALPGPGDLQSVGQLTGFEAEKFVERCRSKGRVPTPLDAAPDVGRAGLDRNLDQHTRGQRAVRVAGEACFRFTDLHAEVTAFEIDGPHLLDAEHFDCKPREGLAHQVGHSVSHTFGVRRQGIPQLHCLDLQVCARHRELLHHPVASGLGHQRALDGPLDAVRGY